MIHEIAQFLHDNDVAELGTSLFYGQMPGITQSLTILVRDTGGTKPNTDIKEIESPTFQIFIRSKNYNMGKEKLTTIRNLLQNSSYVGRWSHWSQ